MNHEEKLNEIRRMSELMKREAEFSKYRHGCSNGIEWCLAILEDRKPEWIMAKDTSEKAKCCGKCSVKKEESRVDVDGWTE